MLSSALATDWQVPGFATIQVAINDAKVVNGDRILVAPGVYEGAIITKAIEVRGTGDATITGGPDFIRIRPHRNASSLRTMVRSRRAGPALVCAIGSLEPLPPTCRRRRRIGLDRLTSRVLVRADGCWPLQLPIPITQRLDEGDDRRFLLRRKSQIAQFITIDVHRHFRRRPRFDVPGIVEMDNFPQRLEDTIV